MKRGEQISSKMEIVFVVDEKSIGKDIEFTIKEMIDDNKDVRIANVIAPAVSPEPVRTYLPLIIWNMLKAGSIVLGETYIAVYKGKQKAKKKGSNGVINTYNNWEVFSAK